MLGIIGAMDVEVELLKKALGFDADEAVGDALIRDIDDDLACAGEEAIGFEDGCAAPLTRRFAGMVFHTGRIGSTPCTVVRCGMGMVNAAACAQLLIDRFDVDAIINTGIAGSLDAAIDICDIVIATGAVNHRMDARPIGYEEGETPDTGKIFACDDAMGAALQTAAEEIGVRTWRGVVGSGDIFVADDDLKAHVRAEFDAVCCEMEGAAIAQVCHINDIPCAVVRAISDKADGADMMDFPAFEKKAAHVCAELIEAYARRD